MGACHLGMRHLACRPTSVVASRGGNEPRAGSFRSRSTGIAHALNVADAFQRLQDIAAAHDLGESDVALARLNAAANRQFPGIGNKCRPRACAVRSGRRPTRAAPGKSTPELSEAFAPIFSPPARPVTTPPSLFRPTSHPASSGRGKKDEVSVQISGFSVLYDLQAGVSPASTPVKDSEANFPGIRESGTKATSAIRSRRYGVPYVVSMLCVDGPARGRWIACRTPTGSS